MEEWKDSYRVHDAGPALPGSLQYAESVHCGSDRRQPFYILYDLA